MFHETLKVGKGAFPERLAAIFAGLTEIVAQYQPQVMAVENVFVSQNPNSALKLGQARGAAICAGVAQGLQITEYAPREVKKALVGRGGADKTQIQHMVRVLLSLKQPLQADAADALAVALCDAHTQSTAQYIRRHQ